MFCASPRKKRSKGKKSPARKSGGDSRPPSNARKPKRTTVLKCKLELKKLKRRLLESGRGLPGLYIKEGRTDPTEFHGVKFVQGGPYKGLILKFFFKIGMKNTPVVRVFMPQPQEVFHPMVNPTNGIIQCFGSPGPKAPRTDAFVHQLMAGLHEAFERPMFEEWRPDDCQNPVVLTIYRQKPVEFNRRKNSAIRQSQNQMFVNHPNSMIRFSPLSGTQFEVLRAKMMTKANLDALSGGQKSATFVEMLRQNEA